MTVFDFLWQAVVILALGAAGAGVCWCRTRRLSPIHFPALIKRSPDLYLTLPLMLGLSSANLYLSLHPALQWDMPPWLQYHWAALSWGSVSGVVAYVFGFCAVVSFRTGSTMKWGSILFGAAVLILIQAYAGWMSRPNLPPMGETRYSADGVLLQTSPFTCVPASGANIASILGIHATEQELAGLFHTTRDGTFPAQALRGMEEIGISGRKVSEGTPISQIKAPAMLFISGDTHAVVYAGTKNGLLEIWNPNSGKAYIPEWWLRRMWDGHALEFYRPAE